MIYLLYTVHVLVCLFLILVVLLQQGKGADLSVFGGGATQAAFGARGAVSLLHKLTVWGFVAFIVTTISIGFMTSADRNSSVLSNVPVSESSAEGDATEAPTAEQPATDVPTTDGATDAEMQPDDAESPATTDEVEEGDGAPIEGADESAGGAADSSDEPVEGEGGAE